MILCPRFVFIHLPKNGGTFVKTIMEQVAGTELRPKPKAVRMVSKALVFARGLPEPLSKGVAGLQRALGVDHVLYINRQKREALGEAYGQHNTCRQIPHGYRRLPIVAACRNPFDRYVSLFQYGEWRRYRGLKTEELRRQYENYPDITFRQFVELANGPYRALFAEGVTLPDDVGFQTVEMVDYLAKDRLECLRALASRRLTGAELREFFYPIRFIRQEALNQDFHALLLELGYEPAAIAVAKNSRRVRPPRSVRTDENEWRPHYDSDLMGDVLHRERLLFELFPEYLPGAAGDSEEARAASSGAAERLHTGPIARH